MTEVEVKKKFDYKDETYEPGDEPDLPDSVADSVVKKDYAESLEEETEEVPEIEAPSAEESTPSQEETGSSEREEVPDKLNNLLHQKYRELWGENYEAPKKELLGDMFGKEHTDELDLVEANEVVGELEERINKSDIEEKAKEEVSDGSKEMNTGGGQKQVLKQNQPKEKEGVSIEDARERAETMGSPQMVQNLIEDMDFSELKQYIWDSDENRDLPYNDLEPKVDLYEMVHPLWEMYTGWSYNIEDFEFNKNEEDGVYECTITIIREGGPSDPTTIKFTKTKKKENLMKQRDINRGMEKEQWKEFMQSLAYKRAMRPQMRLWVDKFVNAYRKTKG